MHDGEFVYEQIESFRDLERRGMYTIETNLIGLPKGIAPNKSLFPLTTYKSTLDLQMQSSRSKIKSIGGMDRWKKKTNNCCLTHIYVPYNTFG